MASEPDEPDEEEFELCEPFDIDHGELEGMRLIDAFVLGVEWQMRKTQIETGRAFDCPIHTPNRERIENILKRRGRDFHVVHVDDEWSHLTVAALGEELDPVEYQ
jgi:hypothetical protein